jgi:tryptophan 2,3-dioxygenase
MAFGRRDREQRPGLTYGSYLNVGHLTELQMLQSEPAQHDELLFIIIHQVYELWFKQMLHELDAVAERLDADQPLGAHRLLHRCVEIQRVLTGQITVLETMTPNDFLTFRDRLMPASGFQSAQFRALEFTCGRKNARHIEVFEEGSREREVLQARYDAPSLGDRFYDLLRRRGFTLDDGRDAPDDAARNQAREARLRELLRLYQQPEQHYELYLLAEALIEFDSSFHLWRLRHVVMVERMIGAKPGTGGSEGVGYLKSTLNQKFFPELWDLRSLLGLGEAWPTPGKGQKGG